MALTSERTTVIGSFAPETNREAMEAAALVSGGISAVEVRLDRFLEAPDLGAVRRSLGAFRTLATLRSAAEGGGFRGSAGERERLLACSLDSGFDLVDVEFRAARELVKKFGGDRVVLSVHDASGIPADLPALVSAMAETGAAHLKIVATARDSSDALSLLELQRANAGRRLTCFAMGEAGIATRALAPYLGAALAFGALTRGNATAPGQIPAADLREIYGVGRARPVERLFALFGGIVSHSLSPALHNANFEAHGQRSLYVPFALQSLAKEFGPLVTRLAALGLPLDGASVTIPFKGEAAAAGGMGTRGAANTLIRSGSAAFVASNTDRTAIAALLPPLPSGGRALVLGAGGTARAALEALRSAGFCASVWSRTASRAEALARETGASALASLEETGRFDVVVNATPLGMKEGDPLPCPPALFGPGVTLIDAPYRPGGTALSRIAREAGASVQDGLTLLVAQAAFQAELFTSKKTSREELRSRLPERIRRDYDVTDVTDVTEVTT